MPREIFELTPPQLEWLIDNQTLSLTSAQALDESSKMGWGGFGPMDGYHHHPPHHHRSHLHEMDHGYHYEDMNENFRHAPHDHYHPFDRSPLQDRDPFKNIPSAGMETEDDEPPKSPKKNKGIQDYDPYPHRVGKLTWEQSFENLQVYKGLNKHCNVPRYFNDHPQLGSWVHRQRLKRKSPKKYGILSPDQIQQLTDLGFCWQLRGEGKEQFIRQAKKAQKAS